MNLQSFKTVRRCLFLFLICLIGITLASHNRTYAKTASSEVNVTNEIIVMFDSSVTTKEQSSILLTYKNELSVIDHFDNYALCMTTEAQNIDELILSLQLHPEILIAELNSEIELQGITNDPYSDTQWALSNTGHYTRITESGIDMSISTPDVDLNIAEAWDIYNKNNTPIREVIIAIIDTGVDTKHPDLVDHIWKNKKEIPGDGIDNDGNGYIDDIEGWDFYNNDNTVCHYIYNTQLKLNTSSPFDSDDHGTHCAGIIAANADNKIGIAGVASNINVKIMPIKIHGGLNGKGTVANAIKAVKYATMMGADIGNISWGSTNYSAALETAMRESTMLFITAAGNDGTDNDLVPLYPASYELDNLISVSFIDANGMLTPNSNYGVSSVDIVAPGADIFSTLVGTYGSMSGSSMAAPHVSGIAAMLYSYSENLYASNIKELILTNLKTLPSLEGSITYSGMPDTAAIVSAMGNLQYDTLIPLLQLSTRYEQQNLIVDLFTEDFNGSGIRATKYAIGERSTGYFKRGTVGLSITDHSLSLAKAGIYTFYTSDYSGNETSLSYEVKDDVEAPLINSSYKVSDDYASITITANFFDSQSGVKTVKYAPGIKTIDDFRSSTQGTTVSLKNDTGIIHLNTPGRYTLYSQDYRGNKTVSVINARIIKAAILSLNRTQKVLGVGKFFRLWPTLTPANSTDSVSYQSSNPDIVTVSKWGLLKGISPGEATITATTSSGVKKTCVVTIKNPTKKQ